MVRGLDVFRHHFREYLDRFVLIGGTACELLMRGSGLDFRATKDLDIVLCIEGLNREFAAVFWSFVHEGAYAIQERSAERRQLYRFQRPGNEAFPVMLELFSRVPSSLDIADGSHLTPIPFAGDGSSLSAILVDDDYYAFIHSGRELLEGLPVVGADRMIALKARAWLDLTRRLESGGLVDRNDIKKHRNDFFRIYRIVDPETKTAVPDRIQADLGEFITAMRTESIDLPSLGIRRLSRDELLDNVARIFRLP